jgi:hypothetical protein
MRLGGLRMTEICAALRFSWTAISTCEGMRFSLAFC